MSRLILIRHAQASFAKDPARAFQDYDRLSALGVRQAEVLGEELLAAGLVFTRVIVGPATRHAQTADAVAAVYTQGGVAHPAACTDDAWGEHEGARVVEAALSDPDRDADLALAAASLREAGGEAERTRAYLRAFRSVTRRWARGELPASFEQGEPWRSFRARVERGVCAVVNEAARGQTVGVFTSAGPIGATVAWALGLGDEAALELAWMVDNATLTELLFDADRVSLKSFNVQPRVGSAELHTYV